MNAKAPRKTRKLARIQAAYKLGAAHYQWRCSNPGKPDEPRRFSSSLERRAFIQGFNDEKAKEVSRG